MAYNFQAALPTNHSFLSAGQNMPPPPGVMQPGVVQPTGQFPLNPGMMPGMGPRVDGSGVPGQPPLPNTQFPLNPAAGGDPTMTPPHVIAGQPATGPQPFNANNFFASLPPSLQGLVQSYAANAGPNGPARHGWGDAIQAWQAQRPEHVPNDGGNSAKAAWRAARPVYSDPTSY